MSPMTNECILFLKKNKDLWNIQDVNAANENRKSDKRDERLAKKLEQQKELDALIAEITLEDEEEGTAASNKN